MVVLKFGVQHRPLPVFLNETLRNAGSQIATYE